MKRMLFLICTMTTIFISCKSQYEYSKHFKYGGQKYLYIGDGMYKGETEGDTIVVAFNMLKQSEDGTLIRDKGITVYKYKEWKLME